MQLQSERQKQPWRIAVHAKSKYLDLRFKATNILPTSKLFPTVPVKLNLNLNLKLHPSLPQPNRSKSQLSIPTRGLSIKSKFLLILGKIRHQRSKNKAAAAKKTSNPRHPEAHFPVNQSRRFAYEETMCVNSSVVGLVALLYQSISRKDEKAIICCGLIILLCLALIFKKLVAKRTRESLAIAIIAVLSCAIGVYLSDILKFFMYQIVSSKH